MRIEVDMSGKIEHTERETVLAYSNGRSKAIKVSARTKRQLQEIFRRSGLPRLFIYRTFAALLYLLVKDELPSITQIIIDTEYPGKERLITDIFAELLHKHKVQEEPLVSFQRIGNTPKVHFAAYDVYVGKKQEDRLVFFEEIAELAIKKYRGHYD